MTRIPTPLACSLLFLVAGTLHSLGADPYHAVYELQPESTALVGCLDLCDCPIQEVEDLHGSFRLDAREAGATFTRFSVEDVFWVIGTESPSVARGHGVFEERIDGAEIIQRFDLELSVNDAVPERFVSESTRSEPSAGEISADVRPAELVCFGQVFRLSARASLATSFVRGDADANGSRQITDAVHVFRYLFGGDPTELPCDDAADVDDNGRVELTDGIYLLNYLFRGGRRPPPPFPACGDDPTADDIDCAEHAPCSGDCRNLARAIADGADMTAASCTAVVRLDYLSLRPVGWQLFCGRYAVVEEDAARERAQADTGYGQSAGILNSPDAEDEYVFYLPAGDFGGVGVVSRRTGLTVFGGSIIWLGRGEITYPQSWRPAEELGAGCPELPGELPAVGYDLIGGDRLEAGAVDTAVDVVWRTALPEGLSMEGYLFDAVVLLYPRSVGAFDPLSAEWIVILNAGWLE